MLDVNKTLPKNPDELRQFTALLLAEVKSQAVLIEKLRHQLAGQRHHRFGSSSESIEQLQLALENSEIAVAKMTAKLRLPDEEPKDKPKRRPIPDHIPRMEVELTTGDDDCPQCSGGLRRLGEDVTEELEYVPGRFIVNRIVRPRFACSGCEAFTQATLPSRPIERGRPGPGLLAHVLVNKYADHLPLYRQSRIFERDGIDIDRSTLADWVGKSTALLEPLADAIGRHVLAGQAIFADDTPVKMLAPGTGKTATARLWACGVIAIWSFDHVGHVSGRDTELLDIALTLHLLAVALWIGVLTPLKRLTSLPKTYTSAADVGHRFGVVATVSVPALIIAGGYMGYQLVGSFSALLGTGYGQALIIKVLLVGGLLGLAAANKLRFIPALRAGEPTAANHLSKSISVEWLVILAVLGTTAVLTTNLTLPT
ncbi:hypothetical protein ROLI_012160 [Roseobacter fucihabitans]|uniref:Transposase n=1 Tax=Roseobacter fucihabitans TaxID=1537242 RepID=A0ABZ2BQC6_9RHOB|nr:IS66 family transposase [Roseobacter litoralis]MBC6964256.1 Copper transport protein YcnJ precursor [Roseobacter litoralis]